MSNKKYVVVIYDNKLEVYGTPIHFNSKEDAVASLTAFLQDITAKDINPTDYEVFHIGSYDPDAGKYDSLEAPKHLFNTRTLKKANPPEKENPLKEDTPTIINKNTINEKVKS